MNQDSFRPLGVCASQFHDFRAFDLFQSVSDLFDRIGFVVFDAYVTFGKTEIFHRQPDPGDDIVSVFQHISVVGCDERFAFRSVDNQRIAFVPDSPD